MSAAAGAVFILRAGVCTKSFGLFRLQVTKSLAPEAWCFFPTSNIVFPTSHDSRLRSGRSLCSLVRNSARLLVTRLRNQVTKGSITERTWARGLLKTRLLITRLRNQVTEGFGWPRISVKGRGRPGLSPKNFHRREA